MKFLTLILVMMLVGLQYQLWFGKNGLTTYQQLSYQVEQQRLNNQGLNERNRLLYHEVSDLKEGLDAIESLARQELGWIRDGETFYRILPSESNNSSVR